MRFYKMLALIIICVLLSVPALAQKPDKETTSPLEKPNKRRYEDFKKIERFAHISIECEGSAEKIGLSKKDLTDYAKLRFKNNFANITLKELAPEEITPTFTDKARAEKVGQIYFLIWATGDDYPIAYYIRCTAGNFDRDSVEIWKQGYLGYGSKENVPDSVKKTIDDAMEELAIDFFKARGEM